tara:strand:- start:1668 stop:1868 length:201 start_codon:yes stop_codon:yes gene_type:complete
MKALSTIGGAIVVWGFIDLGMSWAGTDVYYDWLGIDVGGLYPFTHWIAFGGGAAITILGNLNKEEE